MQNEPSPSHVSRHLRITEPSPWVQRFAALAGPQTPVLDLAAGGGRHGRLFLERGHQVTFLDCTIEPLADLESHPQARLIAADLEDGTPVFEAPGPLANPAFGAVIVVNYLHRPLFPALLAALKPGGVLIYETFARGNEAYARPRNPDHLLKSGELLDLAAGRLQVIAYEHGIVEAADIAGVKQRLTAINDLGCSSRDDGEPKAHPVS